MRLTKGKENLGLPDYMKFGLELEVENVNYSKITKLAKERKWHTDKDPSLTDSGVECVSPVLRETEDSSVWQDVADICSDIKQSPNDLYREAYTDHTCGGHVHFDAGILLGDKNIMKNFLKLWAESEELIYKMCNDKNDPIRKSAMQPSDTHLKDVVKTLFKSPLPEGRNITSLKDCIQVVRNIKVNISNSNRKLNTILSNTLLSRNGMATPRGKQIQKQLESGKLKVGKPKSKIYRDIFVKNKLSQDRYYGLNLSSLGYKKRNTVEFRISNGTINPETVKENVFLYASLIKTAVDMTKEPEKFAERQKKFYQRDISEEEKVDSFLGFIMDEPADRDIFKQRWESVKDAPVFTEAKGAKNFGASFKKNDLKDIAEKVPSQDTKNIFSKIKESLKKQMNVRGVETNGAR